MGYEVKTIVYPAFSVNGSTFSTVTQSGQAVVGEILKFRFQNISSPGSFIFTESGGANLFTNQNITSGAASLDFYPQVVSVLDAGAGTPQIGSPATRAVCAGPIMLTVSGLTSGTGKTFGPITVYYR
jgi:hypothetical protein